ncbi:MAG TPA: hypothetical protein VG454_02640, partial [Gemmatimonadales bacterium]|nr:hypothetical protein [Gemmatimonadales bacterium]
FAGFYWISWVQFGRSAVSALIATLLVAALFEVAEGMTAAVVATKALAGARVVAGSKAFAAMRGHCRVRDLVPDAAGALGAALLLSVWARLTRKPAYVRLGKPRSAAAPRRTPAPAPSPLSGLPTLPRAAVPAPGVPPAPVPARGIVPPPADFSPGPADTAPTQEVAVKKAAAARAVVVQRLRAILARVRPTLQRIWSVILRRRRAIGVALVVLMLVGAGTFVFLGFGPSTAVTEQPQAPPPPPEPPPPPPRPLQSEVEGYYEPNYKFTVSDRRFIRVTLQPEPFLTFARFGAKQDVRCTDARIGPAAVFLRCPLETAGIVVTIDGRFPARYVTSRLDMPVLSAVITVSNVRGEVVYSARDSFYWHVPDPQP